MDERLSCLGVKPRVNARTEIKRLHEELKVTTIYVNHDQAEAIAMADRVAVMNSGEVMQLEPLTIYSRTANSFVAGFVGSHP